jgi:hypothetical protein
LPHLIASGSDDSTGPLATYPFNSLLIEIAGS